MKKRMYKLLSLLLATVITATSVNVDAFAVEKSTELISEEDSVTEELSGDEDSDAVEVNKAVGNEQESAEDSTDVNDKHSEDIIIDELETEDSIEVDEKIEDATNDNSAAETEADYNGYIRLHEELETDVISYDGEGIEETYPVKYKTENLPPLRNQSPYGTCWAHATLACAEINMMKKGINASPNLSELHLSYFTYECTVDDPLGGTEGDSNKGYYGNISNESKRNFADRGGNYNFSSHTLNSWKGADQESVDSRLKYSNTTNVVKNGLDQSLAYDKELVDVHLTNVRRVSTDDIPSMKRLIKEYGAIGIDYFALQEGQYITIDSNNVSFGNVYSSANNCYYFPIEIGETNHAVTIVGWDDSFSKNNFVNSPQNDGAWLVRNSWTTVDNTKNYSGYFWMSYEDHSLRPGTAYAFEVEESNNYDNNYFYDGSFATSYYSPTGKASIANVFTASACENGESLEAVSFDVRSAELDYTIKIYTNVQKSGSYVTDPTNGTLVSTVTGSTLEEGIYTVKLANPVIIDKGNTYSVVIDFAKSGVIRIPVESSASNFFISTAKSQYGQSFTKFIGNTSWSDEGTDGNLRIHALTKNLGQAEAVEVTVTYDANGGDCSKKNGIQISGNKYTDLPIPTREGYDFAGWFTELNGGIYVDENTRVRKTTDHTLYARWLPYAVTVNWDLNLGSEIIVKTEQIRPGEYYPDGPRYSADGTNFLGWFSEKAYGDEINSSVKVTKTEDHTIYGHWESTTPITMNINANGGSCSKTSMSVYAYTPFGDYDIPIPTRDGYIFDGWQLGYGGAIITRDTIVPNYSRPFTIYAKWSVNLSELTVSFDGNGGTPSYNSKKVSMGSNYGSLPTATRTGYEFRVWHTARTGGSPVIESTPVTATTNHTLYAQWKAKDYTVKFDLNGAPGTTPSDKTIAYDSTYGTLPEPSWTGHRFEGWYTQAAGGTKITASSAVTITATQTLYAHWSAKTYNVSFYLNGAAGVQPSDITVTYGQTYGTLPEPSWTGHRFEGWYTQAAGGTKINTTSTVSITADQILYAHWIANTYTVKFNLNGATGTAPSDITVTYGQTYGTLPTPSREGHSFDGWYTSAEGGEEIDSSIIVKITSTQTLYAHWNECTYTVKFDLNGASGTAPYDKTVTYGSTYGTMPVKYRTGYDLEGWFTSPTGGTQITETSTVKITSTQTLYAHWKAKTFTVSFDINGGSGSNPAGRTIAYDSEYGTLPADPVREGYDFAGWYTQRTNGSKVEASTVFNSLSDIYLFAHWTAKTYTVSFDVNGGEGSNPANITVTYDSTYGRMPSDPVKTGYEFLGWYTQATGGSKVEPTTNVKITSAQTLYAQWKAKQFTVYFNSNGGTSVRPSSIMVTYDGTYGTLPTEPTKYGYVFDGWYTDKTGGSKIEASSRVAITGSTTLYARWTAGKYQVSFDKNYEGAADNPEAITVTYGEAYGTLPNMERPGYAFMGWFNSPAGTGKITEETKVEWAQAHTLYAHWEAGKLNISFDGNGDNVTVPGNITRKYGDTYGSLPVATREGYDFAGWYTTATGGTKIEATTIVDKTGNITLYAQWTEKTYAISFNGNGIELIIPSVRRTYGSTYQGTYSAEMGEWPESPARTGYTFDGWYTTAGADGVKIDDTTKVSVASDHSVYAHWIANQYEISFNANGGNCQTAKKTVVYDSMIGELPVATRSGYEFKGWYTQINGGEEVKSDTIYTSAASIILYAHWEKLSYKVTLETFGGSVSPEYVMVKYEENYGELPIPVKTACSFEGWYLEESYVNLVTVSTRVSIEGNHTLYAKWDYANTTATPYITIDGVEVKEDTEVAKNTKVSIKTDTLGADIYYVLNPTVDELNDTSSWNHYDGPIVISQDTILYAFARRSNYKDSALMIRNLTIKNEDDDWGDITYEDRIELLIRKGKITEAEANNDEKINSFKSDVVTNEMWVAGAPNKVTYNGVAQTFDNLHVYNYKKLLTQNVDYTVKYKNNVNAGTANITITGKGFYNNSVTVTFVIEPVVLTKDNVEAPDVTYAYNKKAQWGTTTVMVRMGDADDADAKYVTLKKGKDYIFEYDSKDNYTDPGYYEVRIVGTGNFTVGDDRNDDAVFTQRIIGSTENAKLISKMKFSKIPNQYATGDKVEPAIEIYDKEKDYNLVQNKDFNVVYTNNITAGTATAIIIGMGEYTGNAIMTYKIVAVPISKVVITDFATSFDYTGHAIEQNEMKLYTANAIFTGSDPLTEGVDYEVEYQNNIDAGKKATMIITGKGSYTGTVKKTFTINPLDIASFQDDVECEQTVKYTKGGAKPTLSITDNKNRKLTEGKDYTVSYKNNKSVYTGDDIKKQASLTIKGKGNYTGTLVKYFKISPSSIDEKGIYVDVADIVASDKAGTCKPKVTVYDSDGSKLAAGKDYEKDIICRYVDDGEVTRIVNKKTKETETVKVYAGTKVNVAEDIIPAGTKIEVFVTGKGNYIGDAEKPATKSGVFRYVARDISKGTFKVADQYYINRYLKDDSVIPVEPDISDFDIASFKNGNITEELTSDDFVIIGYSNNTKIGTGKVTIKGIGIYGGTKTITFKIKNRSIR